MADKRCETCTEECPKAQMAHDAAVGRMYATKEFITLQKKIESGQLVEVVRCRDCKHISPSVKAPKNAVWCQELRAYMGMDDFCSYGEPKEKEK